MPYDKITIELSVDKELGRGDFYETLELPATDGKIHDILQRLRVTEKRRILEISITDFPKLPNLINTRINDITVGELNFFAHRVNLLNDEDLVKLNGLFNYKKEQGDFNSGVSMTALINYTYGLDEIMIASCVYDAEQLGMLTNYDPNNEQDEYVPGKINYRKLGEIHRIKDEGIFLDGGYYVGTVGYSYPIVYRNNGYTDIKYNNPASVFRLEVADAPIGDEDNSKNANWIDLPTDVSKIENPGNLVFYGFETAIPQIDRFMFKSMRDLPLLNDIAQKYVKMSDNDKVKFKAVLEAERIKNLMDALLVADILKDYEISDTQFEQEAFYKDYLLHNLKDGFDSKWLEDIHADENSIALIEKLDASITDYGVVSAYGESLYKLVPYDKPHNEFTVQHEDEKFELVEIAGQQALFSNGRVKNDEVPRGLQKYELRDDGSGEICSLERSVFVNHAGTILTKESLLFGSSDYITLDGNNSINFLGEEVTAEEFVSNNFFQDNSENMNIDNIGMQLNL